LPIFSTIFVRFKKKRNLGVGYVSQKRLSDCAFSEKWLSGNHILLGGLYEVLSVVSIFIV
jgi:hypothetical protein